MSKPSVTNRQARWLAGVGFIAAILMIGLDGFSFYQASEVMVSALLASSVAALGWPTWRNIEERKAGP